MYVSLLSTGQVHRARLKGQEVVLKVQRPGLKDLFDIDLKNLRVSVSTTFSTELFYVACVLVSWFLFCFSQVVVWCVIELSALLCFYLGYRRVSPEGGPKIRWCKERLGCNLWWVCQCIVPGTVMWFNVSLFLMNKFWIIMHRSSVAILRFHYSNSSEITMCYIYFQEIDYTKEAANSELFANNFKNLEYVKVPSIYWEYTTPQVLLLPMIISS